MRGDINLYEVRVKHPQEKFGYRGKMVDNGKRSTCVHRLVVSAPSREAAEAVSRFHVYKKVGQHVDDVLVCEIPEKVHDMGMFAFKNRDMQHFKLRCEADAKREQGEEACS
jgi:hypothetical protein